MDFLGILQVRDFENTPRRTKVRRWRRQSLKVPNGLFLGLKSR